MEGRLFLGPVASAEARGARRRRLAHYGSQPDTGCSSRDYAPSTIASYRLGTMLDAAKPTSEFKGQPSLFTRLSAVETELDEMKALLASLRTDCDALREDRDEWRWRAELLLSERQQSLLERCFRRGEALLAFAVTRLASFLAQRGFSASSAGANSIIGRAESHILSKIAAHRSRANRRA